jgi:RHS repeat-associated protein
VRYNNLGQKTSAQYWIWLDGMPLAEVEFKYNSAGAITSTGKYYLHSDHLNTPRLATNQAQTLLWSWDSDAFGLGTPNTDVDGDGVLLDIPLRFPGQVFEAYSNLNYNYFRDYDPNTGRYVQSDPIGLEGGLNTYGYVQANPLISSDMYGLNGTYVSPAVCRGWLCVVPIAAEACASVNPSDLAKAWVQLQLQQTAMLATGANAVLNDSQPDERDLTKIKEKDGNKAAQDAGFADAHEAKDGRGEGGVDIYRDKTTGKNWLWNGVKGGEKEPL